MSKGNTLETDVLKYVLQGVAPSWAALGTLYVSLHTADPGEAGTQSTNETSYTGYARVAVNRSTGGWNVSGNIADNIAAILFPGNSGVSTPTVTHFGIGTASSGAGILLYSGALTAGLVVAALVEPNFAVGALDITED